MKIATLKEVHAGSEEPIFLVFDNVAEVLTTIKNLQMMADHHKFAPENELRFYSQYPDGMRDAIFKRVEGIKNEPELKSTNYLESARLIIEALVMLKDEKEQHGKTEKYLAMKPIAWTTAKIFLEELDNTEF